jgi:hypothetical protein
MPAILLNPFIFQIVGGATTYAGMLLQFQSYGMSLAYGRKLETRNKTTHIPTRLTARASKSNSGFQIRKYKISYVLHWVTSWNSMVKFLHSAAVKRICVRGRPTWRRVSDSSVQVCSVCVCVCARARACVCVRACACARSHDFTAVL